MDFKLVFVSDKYILTKNNMYVCKSYVKDELFKLYVLTIVTNNLRNKIFSSVYILKLFNLWHHRLEHKNFKSYAS